MKKRIQKIISAVCLSCLFTACSASGQTEDGKNGEQKIENQSTVIPESGNTQKESDAMTGEKNKRNDVNLEDYNLVWEENFDGNS